jgi:hypothetical protein
VRGLHEWQNSALALAAVSLRQPGFSFVTTPTPTMADTKDWDGLSGKFRQEFEDKLKNLTWTLETQEARISIIYFYFLFIKIHKIAGIYHLFIFIFIYIDIK